MAEVILRPSGDGSTGGWTKAGGATFASQVVDDPDSPDNDTTYVESAHGPSGADYLFLALDDLPADFESADEVHVKIRFRANSTDDQARPGLGTSPATNIGTRIVLSGEVTQIAYSPAWTLTDPTYITEEKQFTISGNNTKADWDGARLCISPSTTTVGMADATRKLRITAVEVRVVYTPVAGGGAGTPQTGQQGARGRRSRRD